ncbi:unnamed protein product [Orchesella dallaii]|uniref:Uncharacterized protein n=1 Tax=Orchesella dallaii TaxID=48710 RepID=A0ABP1RQK9_9HEXA
MVIAPANTGVRILIIVVIKFTAPKIEEAPARCRLKIDKSTEAPAWAIPAAKGGYTVHPVPAPLSTKPPANNKVNDGGSNQKLILFIRGKAISGAPIIKGTNQLPKPPIIMDGLMLVGEKSLTQTKLRSTGHEQSLPHCTTPVFKLLSVASIYQ